MVGGGFDVGRLKTGPIRFRASHSFELQAWSRSTPRSRLKLGSGLEKVLDFEKT